MSHSWRDQAPETPIRSDAITLGERAITRPIGLLRPLVRRYVGYRHTGLTPGIHRGLPSPYLTLIISLGPPTRVSTMDHPNGPPDEFLALIGGLHTRSATIYHDDSMCGVQIDLTPAGARSLLGVPAGKLGPGIHHLEDDLGPDSDDLVGGIVDAPDWRSRFAIIDRILGRRAGRIAPMEAPLAHAWDLLLGTGSEVRVGQVAGEVGWSRRQLGERFSREYGLTAKEAVRVARFHRSTVLLQNQPGLTIGAAAGACGYYDQAHLAREWREFAGCPPSTWLDTEELPFIQDTRDEDEAD